MADAKGYVARFVLHDQAGDLPRDGVGRVMFQKAQQMQKRAFAQNR